MRIDYYGGAQGVAGGSPGFHFALIVARVTANRANPGGLKHRDTQRLRPLHQQGVQIFTGQRAAVPVRARRADGKVCDQCRRLTHPSDLSQLRAGMSPDASANAQFIQQGQCSGRDAFTTYLATRKAVLFDQHHLPACTCQQDCGGCARGSRAHHQCICRSGHALSPAGACARAEKR